MKRGPEYIYANNALLQKPQENDALLLTILPEKHLNVMPFLCFCLPLKVSDFCPFSIGQAAIFRDDTSGHFWHRFDFDAIQWKWQDREETDLKNIKISPVL